MIYTDKPATIPANSWKPIFSGGEKGSVKIVKVVPKLTKRMARDSVLTLNLNSSSSNSWFFHWVFCVLFDL